MLQFAKCKVLLLEGIILSILDCDVMQHCSSLFSQIWKKYKVK